MEERESDQSNEPTPEKEEHNPPEKDKMVKLKDTEYKKLLEESKELKEYKDKYLRLYAEFENARKRMERERFEFVKYANEVLIVEFLTILDDLERSVQVAREKHQDYHPRTD